VRSPVVGEPDGTLAERALSGDERAFAEIVRRYKQPLFRIVYRIAANEDDALEILQEAFVAAHRALSRYDPSRPMQAWLARIAINKARDWRRREVVRRALRSFLPIGAASEVADDSHPADIVVADRQELERVLAEIGKLPSNLKEVLVLRTLEGFSQAETANILGISEKAVETRLYRARQRLRGSIGV
jgi:RNA polymerase sigma-70 factor (ECF subfamily)